MMQQSTAVRNRNASAILGGKDDQYPGALDLFQELLNTQSSPTFLTKLTIATKSVRFGSFAPVLPCLIQS